MSVMTSLLTSFSEAEANQVPGSFDIHSLTGAYSRSSLLSVSAPSASVPILPLAGDNQSCVIYNNYTRTINICGGFANLNTINKILHNPFVLNKTSEKIWFLDANIWISNGATLFINSSDTSWLKINSTSPESAYAISNSGNLIIDKVKVSSWNSSTKSEAASSTYEVPRSYLVMNWNGTGHMNITNSNLNNLGFNGTNGTWGISYYSGAGSKVQNNSISSNYRSLYFGQNASDIFIADNDINKGLQSGLNLYRSSNLSITNNNIGNNRAHGIACLEQCGFILIKNNRISNNLREGINLNQKTTNSFIFDNVLYNNSRSGIAVWNSTDNIIARNTVTQGKFGITIADNAYNNSVSQNSINNSYQSGIHVHSNARNNEVKQNIVSNAGAGGISIIGSNNNSLIQNLVTNNSKYGIRFLNASNNLLSENRVVGNIPYNYYSMPDSNYNILKDTLFSNSTLRFFDTTTSAIVQNSDNKVVMTNKKIPTSAYESFTSLIVRPPPKKIVADTLDMSVVPSQDYVNISSISKNFDSYSKPKKWTETSPYPDITSEYTIGGFPPNTQIGIKINGSFWSAHTSNGSGHISFTHDRDEREGILVSVFQAQPDNQAAVSTMAFLAAIIAASALFIILRKLRKRKQRPF
jgi:parallel beta-helix repeat protein